MDDFDWDAYLNAMGIGDQAKSPVASRADSVQDPPEVKQRDVPMQAAPPPNVPDRMPGAPDPIKLPAPPKADVTDPDLESFKQNQMAQPPPQSGANAAGGAVSDAIGIALMF